ncbi:hypothetical protein AQ619_05615 [Caulobacter henricii]|uniref:Uncharacterized protein n=1 Tax=Caulobacter henricii TaxID=69395 RepID=A0A0N7JHA8_9CAUL|nr:hypothetical protein AQ619_05615 [Caulobacter henricii]
MTESEFPKWKTHQGWIEPERLVFIDQTRGIDGPINGEFFRHDIEQVLAPPLAPGPLKPRGERL